MRSTLLELTGVSRHYSSGDDTVMALNNINIKIEAGEMVALVGPSGSGKSTLMNILGCLDQPTSGSYQVAGNATNAMSADDLARLRREHFGFIFQRYHLLPDLDALGNVSIPAIYAGQSASARRQRAQALLDRLGLSNRSHHRPGQLSGGQQQRVCIARALMNGGHVILADEPTGALDRYHGQEVIHILKKLHAEGHTVIIVTHDLHVAEHAQRVIEISDGEVVADRLQPNHAVDTPAKLPVAVQGNRTLARPVSWRSIGSSLLEACRMALLSMRAHRLRSFLTMLGVIIGIASVVSVVALGEGSRRKILESIALLGTNTIVIYPGRGYGDRNAEALRTLDADDAEALAQRPYADSVTPEVATAVTVRYRNVSVNASLKGVGEQYFRVHGLQMMAGTGFTSDGVRRQMQEVVIDDNARQSLLGKSRYPIGQVLMLGDVPCRVIGVVKSQGHMPDGTLSLWIPFTTALTRIIGQSQLQSIAVRVRDGASTLEAEQDMTRLLGLRHGATDFFVQNNDNIRRAVESTTTTMTLLGSMIAVISLVVGGIGVMNIMLVSVTERVAEIGVCIAVGARQADIMRQFLIESVLICLIGGVLGIVVAFGFGAVFSNMSSQFQMHYSLDAIAMACACSTLIGLVFGFFPARGAARLDPINALARE
ncbi:MacB family efflux pump subunit [Variovorax sp. E3]|uniref:MacB family efflux pump subunit n=1 Tax=Variovorax sp. E3 TaxID=1914993 RepID=UPI0018DB9151|nr:MacB family efflux pump subunit [Variovorax sp. E3]